MFRENIYDVMRSTGEKVDRLLIPSNRRLNAYAKEVLLGAGLDMNNAVAVDEKRFKAKGLNVVLERGENIPRMVAEYGLKGEVVLGITGDDLFDEFRYQDPTNMLRVENTYDWFDEAAMFFRPALCLINRSGSADDIAPRFAIPKKYEQTSLAYLIKSEFTRKSDFSALGPSTIDVLEGGVEKSVGQGNANCAIDIVYSGDTLRQYGLKIVDVVRFSDLVVISPLKGKSTLDATLRRG